MLKTLRGELHLKTNKIIFSILNYSAVKRVIKQGEMNTTTRAMASIASKENECSDWLND